MHFPATHSINFWCSSVEPEEIAQDAVLFKDVSYTFKSEYGEEDIRSSLEEMFPPVYCEFEDTFWPKGNVEMPIGDDVFRQVKKID